jgi:hypothetical protein
MSRMLGTLEFARAWRLTRPAVRARLRHIEDVERDYAEDQKTVRRWSARKIIRVNANLYLQRWAHEYGDLTNPPDHRVLASIRVHDGELKSLDRRDDQHAAEIIELRNELKALRQEFQELRAVVMRRIK